MPMPLVLKEEGVAIHIYPIDDAKLIHCYDGDIESETEVVIDLNTGLVVGYGPGNKIPTASFQKKALLLVHKRRSQLRQIWAEIRKQT